jgi:ribosomal protein S18 acetylase RimI-like enzyme
MRYRLVPATSADRAWLDELRRAAYHDLFRATWGAWDEARHLRHGAACWERGNVAIVELDGERVGMLQLLEHEDALEIAEIQIQPSHQGRGIGTLLLRDAIARAHGRGRKVSLSTGLQNRRAVGLYERLGFRHVSRSETHVHMECEPVG